MKIGDKVIRTRNNNGEMKIGTVGTISYIFGETLKINEVSGGWSVGYFKVIETENYEIY